MRRSVTGWREGNIAGCLVDSSKLDFSRRPPTHISPSDIFGLRFLRQWWLEFSKRSFCTTLMMRFSALAMSLTCKSLAQFFPLKESFALINQATIRNSLFQFEYLLNRLFQNEAWTVQRIVFFNFTPSSSSVSTRFSGGSGFGRGTFSSKKEGPWIQRCHFSSPCLRPLDAMSAGFWEDGTYFHCEGEVTSRIFATLFVMKIFRDLVSLKMYFSTIMESDVLWVKHVLSLAELY